MIWRLLLLLFSHFGQFRVIISKSTYYYFIINNTVWARRLVRILKIYKFFGQIIQIVNFRKFDHSSSEAVVQRFSENMQQIYRTPMTKCNFSKVALHFGIGILRYICCIFPEHVFLKIPLDGCFWQFQ